MDCRPIIFIVSVVLPGYGIITEHRSVETLQMSIPFLGFGLFSRINEDKANTFVETQHDYDKDGFTEDKGDCNDMNGNQNQCPRNMWWYDNDCNGIVDDNAIDMGTWYLDADGDGFKVESTQLVACYDKPDGYIELNEKSWLWRYVCIDTSRWNRAMWLSDNKMALWTTTMAPMPRGMWIRWRWAGSIHYPSLPVLRKWNVRTVMLVITVIAMTTMRVIRLWTE